MKDFMNYKEGDKIIPDISIYYGHMFLSPDNVNIKRKENENNKDL